jgi:hypothetical protein
MPQKHQKSALERGHEVSFSRGKTEGIAEGEAKAKADIAKKLIRLGFDNSYIRELTELDLATVKAFRKELRRPEPADKAQA